MNFNSLEEIELALKQKDLERQIAQEQIKNQYYQLEHEWTGSLFSKPIVTKLIRLGVSYLIRRLTK